MRNIITWLTSLQCAIHTCLLIGCQSTPISLAICPLKSTWCKFDFDVTPMHAIESSNGCAHVTTAQLWCHTMDMDKISCRSNYGCLNESVMDFPSNLFELRLKVISVNILDILIDSDPDIQIQGTVKPLIQDAPEKAIIMLITQM